ncbi:hypothetical protein Ancab_040585 [Ancistrocladus abbreviatus]
MSASLFITGNLYLQEIVGVGMMIAKLSLSKDLKLSSMAISMKKKYDKYWGSGQNMNVLLFIAVILDPRRKMQYVDWAIEETYDIDAGSVLRDKVKDALKSLFDYYGSIVLKQSTCCGSEQSSGSMGHNDIDSQNINEVDVHNLMEYEFVKQARSKESLEKKTELDRYLEETLEVHTIGRHFDILGWWKRNMERFPILALMAKDILAIPVSTVASESAFSTGNRVLDPFRSSLTPRLVEVLICSQDWLRSCHMPLSLEETLEELEDMEADLSSILVEQVVIEIDE